MIERTSFDTPILPRLPTIIAEIQSGIFQIPYFQRPFVWSDQQRIDLLDSIIKGLPIGSLLVWRSGSQDLQTYETIAGIPVVSSKYRPAYIIDGHQRISTLFGALVKPVSSRSEGRAQWPIYYELGAGEIPAFHLPPKRGIVPDNWLPLDILFDSRALYKFQQNLLNKNEDDKVEEVERIANLFKDYIVPVVPLVTDNLDLVTDAFVRINSQGEAMTEAHMLRALTHLKGEIDTDAAFQNINKDLKETGWGEIPEQVLVNIIKMVFDLDVYLSSVRDIFAKLKKKEHIMVLPKIRDSIKDAVTFLKSIGIAGQAALPYAYQLVIITIILYRYPNLGTSPTRLERWFLQTTYTGYFSGQKSGKIKKAISQLLSDKEDIDLETKEVTKITTLRHGTVRTKAFLYFLTRQVQDPKARTRRQALLSDNDRPFVKIFPQLPITPGNIVLAAASEILSLREELAQLSPEKADEFVISTAHPSLISEPQKWVEAREKDLLEREAIFIESLGLKLIDAEDSE